MTLLVALRVANSAVLSWRAYTREIIRLDMFLASDPVGAVRWLALALALMTIGLQQRANRYGRPSFERRASREMRSTGAKLRSVTACDRPADIHSDAGCVGRGVEV